MLSVVPIACLCGTALCNYKLAAALAGKYQWADKNLLTSNLVPARSRNLLFEAYGSLDGLKGNCTVND